MLAHIGGRKTTIVLLAIIVVALHDVLGLDDAAVEQVVFLALGGSGVIALEDAVGALKGKTKPQTLVGKK